MGDAHALISKKLQFGLRVRISGDTAAQGGGKKKEARRKQLLCYTLVSKFLIYVLLQSFLSRWQLDNLVEPWIRG